MFTSDPTQLIISFASLLLVSVLCSKAAARTGLPVLFIFLMVGMGVRMVNNMANIEDYYVYIKFLGGITLALVLFSGGLNTQYNHIRPIIYEGLSLSTIGVMLTTAIIGAFMHYVFHFSWTKGLLLGAMVSSTDAAAVFSILRVNKINLQHHLAPLLELESGSNDAMAYFLTITLTGLLLDGTQHWTVLLLHFGKEMLLGGALGLGMGWLMRKVINKVKLNYDAFYPALSFAMVLFTYAFTHQVGGNSFLAVYIAGIVMGDKQFIHRKSLTNFYEGISWLTQIVLFIGLGLLVNPLIELRAALSWGLPLALILIFFARPISVMSALCFSRKINRRQKAFVSWVGLRGAVPLVLAMHPLTQGGQLTTRAMQDCRQILCIVYVVVITSMLLQGSTLYRVAQWLGLVEKMPIEKETAAITLSEKVKTQLVETRVAHTAKIVGKRLFEIGLPKLSLVVLIEREKQYLIPRGDTLIQGGDRLLMLVSHVDEISTIRACLM